MSRSGGGGGVCACETCPEWNIKLCPLTDNSLDGVLSLSRCHSGIICFPSATSSSILPLYLCGQFHIRIQVFGPARVARWREETRTDGEDNTLDCIHPLLLTIGLCNVPPHYVSSFPVLFVYLTSSLHKHALALSV